MDACKLSYGYEASTVANYLANRHGKCYDNSKLNVLEKEKKLMRNDNYISLCHYIEGANLEPNEEGYDALFGLKHWLFDDKEFCKLFKGDLNNRIKDDIDMLAINNLCKNRIEEFLSYNSKERATIEEKVIDNPEIQYLILQSFHDGNIIGIAKENNDLIIHIDNSAAMSAVRECKIRFIKYKMIEKNIFNYRTEGSILSKVRKGYISGTNFHILNGELYFSIFLFNQNYSLMTDICIIKFTNITFDEKLEFETIDLEEGYVFLTREKAEELSKDIEKEKMKR